MCDLIDSLPPDLLVTGTVGDKHNLKQWNSAYGEERLIDEYMSAAIREARLLLRENDFLGRGDSGDMLWLICPFESSDRRSIPRGPDRRHGTNPLAVAKRLNDALRMTPIPPDVRERYIRGASLKYFGSAEDPRAHTLPGYPQVDWEPIEVGPARTLFTRIHAAERRLFTTKLRLEL